MALTPRFGLSTIPSSANNVPDETPNTQPDLLANMPFVLNPVTDRYAIDPSQYPNAAALALGLMKGHRILVTYYRLLNNQGSNNRTNMTDLPAMRDVLNTEYQKIMNLEITLPNGFTFTANPAQGSATMEGNALLYPGMNPSIGDMFLMGTGDGQVGVCRVSSIVINSWRQDRASIIKFVVTQFLDPSVAAPMEGSVTLTSYFSKQNYLAGTRSLLSEQTYLQLQYIKAFRSNVCQYYFNTFFSRDLCSFVRPDGLYDPYVVLFMDGKLTTDDVVIRPKNLLGRVPDLYAKTLWSRLDDRYNTTLYGILPYYDLGGFNERAMGVFMSELLGYSILYPTSDGTLGTPYLYTPNFYTNNQSEMTPEELLIYTAITQRLAGDLSVLITNYLDPVYTLSALDQFYKIPIYIHLIDMSLQSQYREVDAPGMNFQNQS